MPASAIYAASPADGPLRQGEILSGVAEYRLDVAAMSDNPLTGHSVPFRRIEHPLIIVISQDCDWDWDYRWRFRSDATETSEATKELPSVLMCEVNTAAEIRNLPAVNSSIWKRIRINRDERYHFLEQVPSECDALQQGLSEMAIDFKRCFSIPTPELYLQLKTQAKRRCRLVSPYLEHFSQRVFNYHARIGLPEDHRSEPEGR